MTRDSGAYVTSPERGIFVAIHDCGKVVAARVNEPAWDDNDEGVAEFQAVQAGRPIQFWTRRPDLDEWCECFRREPVASPDSTEAES